MLGVDAEARQIANGGVGEHVVADLGHHHDRGAELGGGDRLIGAFPAVAHLETGRLDGLAADGHAVHVGHEIDHVAADDRDPRGLVRRHGRSPSMAAAAAAA